MLRRFVFLFLITSAAFAFAGDPVTNASEDGFQSGIKLYQELKYSEAFDKFKKEFSDGKDFASLHYNWGLAAYKLKQKGYAVGLWRRALFLDPEFRPAQQALEIVEHELPRDTSGETSSWWSFRTHILDRASTGKFLFLTWVLLGLSGFLLVRYVAARKTALVKELPMPKPPTVGVGLLVVMLLFAFFSIAKIFSVFEIHATVVTSTATMHTGPNGDDNAIFDVLEGFDVIVQSVHNGWVQINLRSGQSGWVKADSLIQHTGKNRLW
jgi:hypothetical protein